MLKEKRSVGIILVIVLAVLTVAGFVVTSVQGKGNGEIGVVNMEAVFTQYMAPPLIEARDVMQQEFDARVDELTDDEKASIFMEYQTQLEILEMQYTADIEQAVAEVAKANGLLIIVDQLGVLYGGSDLTKNVLDALK